jgi:hypothetical protein
LNDVSSDINNCTSDICIYIKLLIDNVKKKCYEADNMLNTLKDDTEYPKTKVAIQQTMIDINLIREKIYDLYIKYLNGNNSESKIDVYNPSPQGNGISYVSSDIFVPLFPDEPIPTPPAPIPSSPSSPPAPTTNTFTPNPTPNPNTNPDSSPNNTPTTTPVPPSPPIPTRPNDENAKINGFKTSLETIINNIKTGIDKRINSMWDMSKNECKLTSENNNTNCIEINKYINNYTREYLHVIPLLDNLINNFKYYYYNKDTYDIVIKQIINKLNDMNGIYNEILNLYNNNQSNNTNNNNESPNFPEIKRPDILILPADIIPPPTEPTNTTFNTYVETVFEYINNIYTYLQKVDSLYKKKCTPNNETGYKFTCIKLEDLLKTSSTLYYTINNNLLDIINDKNNRSAPMNNINENKKKLDDKISEIDKLIKVKFSDDKDLKNINKPVDTNTEFFSNTASGNASTNTSPSAPQTTTGSSVLTSISSKLNTGVEYVWGLVINNQLRVFGIFLVCCSILIAVVLLVRIKILPKEKCNIIPDPTPPPTVVNVEVTIEMLNKLISDNIKLNEIYNSKYDSIKVNYRKAYYESLNANNIQMWTPRLQILYLVCYVILSGIYFYKVKDTTLIKKIMVLLSIFIMTNVYVLKFIILFIIYLYNVLSVRYLYNITN